MTDDIFKLKPTKSAVIEDDEKFVIYAQNEIMQKLRMLQKSNCIATAYFDTGKQSLLTAVIDVLPDKNIVLLDYGSDETANKALISDDSVTIKSQLAGVTAKFTVNKIQKARYQNQTVFACKIPSNMLWVQRRDTYRVTLPMNINAFCIVHHNDDKARQYRIHDISVGGLALEDIEKNQEFALGSIFKKCEITLPEFGRSEERRVGKECRL